MATSTITKPNSEWKFFRGTITTDSTYGAIIIPNANPKKLFVTLAGSGSSAPPTYYLHWVTDKSVVVRKIADSSMVKNTSINITALYLE